MIFNATAIFRLEPAGDQRGTPLLSTMADDEERSPRGLAVRRLCA